MTGSTEMGVAALKSALPAEAWTDDPNVIAPWLVEWRDRWRGRTPLMLTPCSTDEVARAIGVCAAHGLAVVPQGGNTGLVGGQIPEGEVLLSLRKMRAVRDADPAGDTLTVEAGLTLAEVQATAADLDRVFPLSLAAEGSATIGGVISTNAGGTAVLRYGMMRDLVLGLEAVMADGRVFDRLSRLRKDNTGYDLKQLLIGAEGTLGVVTAATLKLFPVMRSRATAVAGMADPAAALDLLALAKRQTSGGVEAFELMKRIGVDCAVRHIPGIREPIDGVHPWYVLVEIVSGEPGAADGAMERILSEGLDRGYLDDAVVASNETQRAAMWRLREEQSAALKPEGGGWKHDVSVPIARIGDFLSRADEAIARFATGARISAFGHLGDGNIHFDVLPPVSADRAAFLGRWMEGSRIVHDIVSDLGGSISAEHGLGRLKTIEAARYKSDVELDMMRAVRHALDPKGIMNPGVLF